MHVSDRGQRCVTDQDSLTKCFILVSWCEVRYACEHNNHPEDHYCCNERKQLHLGQTMLDNNVYHNREQCQGDSADGNADVKYRLSETTQPHCAVLDIVE